MLNWFRSLWRTSSRNKAFVAKKPASRPWTEIEFRELAANSQEFEMFRRDTAALYCVLGDLEAVGISMEDIDKAFSEAIAESTAGRAPYQGGALSRLDCFVSRNRVIRKRADYFHIHMRESHEDLCLIHWHTVPHDPTTIRLLQVSTDNSGARAIVMTEHMQIAWTDNDMYESVPSRIRWWLLREDGQWKIHEFEPVFA